MLLQTVILAVALATRASGLLYPKDSSSRTVKSLDGIWHFLLDTSSSGDDSFVNKWYSKPLASVSNWYTLTSGGRAGTVVATTCTVLVERFKYFMG